MAQTEEKDLAADFAKLMSGAAAEAQSTPERDPSAPYGYKEDGTPKKAAGRPRGPRKPPPSAEELRALRVGSVGDAEASGDDDPAGRAPPAPTEDRAPEAPKRKSFISRRDKRAQKAQAPLPPWKEGGIARGMNKLYRRAGKFIRPFDPELGAAFIEVTKKEDEEDVTVGEAWEELARVNPRVRRALVRMLEGGAYGQLFMAHLPIAIALISKDSVRRHIPFMRIIESMAEPDEETAPGEGGLPGGMTMDDFGQAMAVAREQMARMGMPVTDDMAAQVAAQFSSGAAESAAAPTNGSPPRRSQPRRSTRSSRHGLRTARPDQGSTPG